MSLVIRAKNNPNIVLASSNDHDGKAVIVEGGWYFDKDQVDMTYLRITDRLYNCPYKGVANWVDLELPDNKPARNVGWVYENPKAGFDHIAGRIAFYGRETSSTVADQSEQLSV